MQVIDRLSAVIARVNDDSIPVVQILTAGNLRGDAHQVAHAAAVWSPLVFASDAM